MKLASAFWVIPREFMLNGIMYDIYLTDTFKKNLVYYFFEDQNESACRELLLKTNDHGVPLSCSKKNKQNPLKYLMKDITLVNNNFELYQAKTEQNKEDVIFQEKNLKPTQLL
jgi:hypothetical protein